MARTALGLAWHLWARSRLGMLGLVAYTVALALVAHGSPTLLSRPGIFALVVVLPVLWWLLFLIGVFSHAEADLAAPESGYPPYLMLLPARTLALVLWPMLYGTVAIGGAWIAFRGLIAVPSQHPVPLWWPAALLAAVLASLQALLWFPLGIAFLRVPLIFAVVPALLWHAYAAALARVPDADLARSFLPVVLAAFLAAVVGVSLARRGSALGLGARAGAPSRAAAVEPPPFASPAEAQLWLEWRRNGLALPLVVAAVCALFALPILLVSDVGPAYLWLPFASDPEALYRIHTRVSMMWAIVPVYVLPLCGLAVGTGLRKGDSRRADMSLNPFFGTRPLPSPDLVAIKLRVAARSALLALGVLALFLAACLLLPASPREGSDAVLPLGALVLPLLTPATWLALLGTALVLGLLTWRNQVQWLPVDFSGRPWLPRAYPIAQVFLGVSYLVMWMWADAGTHPNPVEKHLTGILAVLVVVKLSAGLWVVGELRRRGMVSRRALSAWAAGWLWTAILLYAWALWVVPELRPQAVDTALGMVLLMPLTRLALSPLALDRARHA